MAYVEGATNACGVVQGSPRSNTIHSMALKPVTALDTVTESLNCRGRESRPIRSGSEVSDEPVASLLPPHVTWEVDGLATGGPWGFDRQADIVEQRLVRTVTHPPRP